MATGVKPRDDEPQLTRSDIEMLETALKNQTFRKLLADYCEEIRDPENQALYQREMTQLEKERGMDVTFVNPQPGYVMKTSVAGDRKAFVNICSSDTAGKPTCSIRVVDGVKGLDWQIPYTLIPPREDYDTKRQRCVIYDVVFHPDTLRMAANNTRFRELVNKTALDALHSSYNISLDLNNIRFPRSTYKGSAVPAVIRTADPNFVEGEQDDAGLAPEVIEKLYPQRSYPEPTNKVHKERIDVKLSSKDEKNQYTTPKYVIRQQKNVDLQDYTFDKHNKRHSAIPSQIVVEVNLPLISSSSDCTLDVHGKDFSLVCDQPAKYKLQITLPYSVDDERGNAKFDKTKRALIVTLPVSKSNFVTDLPLDAQMRRDSGVESEGNSSGSDEESSKLSLVTELDSSPPAKQADAVPLAEEHTLEFLDPNVNYVLPSHTCNMLDDTIAFTFHVKNTDPESVATDLRECNTIHIKFTSIGSGYVPIYYSAVIKFEDGIIFEHVTAEAWDNNVILHLESASKPEFVFIGLHEDNLVREGLNIISTSDKSKITKDEEVTHNEELAKPIIEVTNMFKETTVTVTSNDSGSESSGEATQPTSTKYPIRVKSNSNDSGAKGILRKPHNIARSLSESSAGDIASSVDYISSDCIPEESSLKKTVRFNEVIARQFYRYNSSIEGQKKKNQRKKSKKRSLERRKSESEAEDEVINKKVTEKQEVSEKTRHDSGIADTSDADNDDKNCSDAAKPLAPLTTCATIQHKTDMYDPEKLNKGKYLEVNFKNDLIFDLDI